MPNRQAGSKHVSPADSASIAKYGIKTLSLTTRWEVDTNDLDVAAGRLLARYAEPPAQYDLDLSWLMDGYGLAVTLGDLIFITDPAHNIVNELVEVQEMEAYLRDQYSRFRAESALALAGKFMRFCSDVDEGDGKDITANNFATRWSERYWFVGEADIGSEHDDGMITNPGFDADGNVNGDIDADYGTPDNWGNSIEEEFMFY